jgi:hypothetical protein
MSDETAGTTADLDRTDIAISIAGAVALAVYSSWMAADFLPRWVVFAIVVLGSGYLLLAQTDRRARIGYTAYVLAGLLVVTPLVLVLPDAVYADTFGLSALSLVFTTANLLVFLVFLAVGSVVAGISYRYGNAT